MPSLAIKEDRPPSELRRLAKAEKNSRVSRRLLALAAALDGVSREAAAKSGGMDRQTLRDWVHRYNEEDLDGLRDRPGTGRKPRLDEGRQAALKAMVLRGPPKSSGLSVWRIVDIQALIEREYGVHHCETRVSAILKELGLSYMTARPRHPKSDEKTQADFKKNSRGRSGG